MSDFNLPCECGRSITVSQGMAGTSLACACGRMFLVPSLSELKARAGLPRYDIGPAILLRQLAATDELPTGEACLRCDCPTDQIVQVSIECERAPSGDPDDSTAWLVILFGWLGALAALGRREGNARDFGGSVIAPAALRLCMGCRRGIRIRSRRAGAFRLVAIATLIGGLLITRLWSTWGLALLPVSGLFWWLGTVERRRHQSVVKQALRRVPLYGELLDRYPQSHVVWTGVK